MKKSAVWLGSLALVLALGFSGYAVADSPNLQAGNGNFDGYVRIAGPLTFESFDNANTPPIPYYRNSGGPVGVGLIPAGSKCAHVQLGTGSAQDGSAVDGEIIASDYNNPEAFISVPGIHPDVTVAGYEFGHNNQTDYINRLRVCITRKAAEATVFNYFIVNVGWSG